VISNQLDFDAVHTCAIARWPVSPSSVPSRTRRISGAEFDATEDRRAAPRAEGAVLAGRRVVLGDHLIAGDDAEVLRPR
jgi:hypothetical protein